MKRIHNNYLTVLFTGLIFLISFCSVSNAEDNINETKSQDQHVTERYDVIKKKQNKDYKTGVYNDNKKDYVKKWINEDISYHKRLIKLKSDYLVWAKEEISKNNEVNFYKYESLKELSNTEKKILLEYHNSLFKNIKDKKSNVRKKLIKDRKKNIDQIKLTVEKNSYDEQKDVMKNDNDIGGNKEDIGINIIYIFYAVMSILVIVFAFIFFKKRNFR